MNKNKRQTRRASGTAASEAGNGASLYEREFKPDYTQTIKDLRRIGILAGTFMGVLVILSFFLR